MANRFIGINTGSYSESTPNIGLDYNGGHPRVYFGDGGEKYFKADMSAGVVEIGRDVKFRGADTLFKDDIYIRDLLMNDSAVKTVYTVGSPLYQRGLLSCDSNEEIGKALQFYELTTSPDWAYDRVWRASITIDTLNNVSYASFGPASWGSGGNTENQGLYFLKKNGGSAWYAKAADNWNFPTIDETEVNIGSISSGKHLFEIFYTAGSKAEFYVDGALAATITNSLPTSGHANSWYVWDAGIGVIGTISGEDYIRLNEVKFWQDGP